jgi:hypothetical protein
MIGVMLQMGTLEYLGKEGGEAESEEKAGGAAGEERETTYPYAIKKKAAKTEKKGEKKAESSKTK